MYHTVSQQPVGLEDVCCRVLLVGLHTESQQVGVHGAGRDLYFWKLEYLVGPSS